MSGTILDYLHFATISYTMAVLVAMFFAVFLFWRGGRHQLVDSEELFDLVLVSLAGAFLFGRVFEFLGNPDRFHFLFSRLVFFNAFGGLDFYGVLLGIFVSVWLYLRRKRTKVWHILDIAAAPLVFGQMIVTVGSQLAGTMVGREMHLPFYNIAGKYPVGYLYFLGYFLIFVSLKRLESRKRHVGFFACFYLISVSVLDLTLYFFRVDSTKIGEFSFHLVIPLVFLALGITIWHLLGRRSIKDDLKCFFAFVLLSVLAFKRIGKDVEEAGRLSRVVVLSPYFLVRSVFGILKVIAKEAKNSIFEILIVLGVKHDRT